MPVAGTRVGDVRNRSADVHGGYYRQRSDAKRSLLSSPPWAER